MPGDISKNTKFMAKKSYPEPKVEGKNIFYANLLLQDYAGMVSEFTAVSLYVYQHIVSEDEYADYSYLIGKISIVEMKHLDLLGDTIRLLGTAPIYTNSVYPCNKLWTAAYVNFDCRIENMIREDIKSECAAIEQYNKHICMINDTYIRKLLKRIVMDEEIHLKYLKKFYEKLKR
ncbi:ferritin-like domain-containing protein [Clostridium sp. JN-1]|uniref:ferritin-like domain-containing protein n=1 Tax=Clostridium sp. JN-1 TaxID=2483110 RepID=UPI000F0B2A81|nr:ferritin-like domain-containing protein [Clostridium sp. JN-1]